MTLPARIGRYEVEALLGQGGMGAVYRARDPELDRTVAVKTVSPILLSSEELRREYLERFRREARAAGRLSHPNIVSVYDLGVDGETVFFVMEYVPGVSLETILKENPVLPVAQAARIVEQVASGLEEAHRQGIVHRDVKPANVFMDERGRVKVGDFGIARVEGSELTQAGVGLGTPGYSAPEVLRGGTATARSDVFALGVLAYRLFSKDAPEVEVARASAQSSGDVDVGINASINGVGHGVLGADRFAEYQTPKENTGQCKEPDVGAHESGEVDLEHSENHAVRAKNRKTKRHHG
jgi:serine/threonine-protein kinase